MHFFPLYIDPGTGSALFSILIGAAATLYFVVRALIIKAKVFFSGGRAKVTSGVLCPYVIYNEGKQYCNVFKPVLDEFERRGTPLSYLTSAEDDPLLKAGYKFVKGEFIGEGNKAYARLNLLTADVVLMTTPGLDVYQLKRSKAVKHYAHVVHMAADVSTYRLFALDYFDSVLLSGDYQGGAIRELEKQRGLPAKELVTVGCTYLDMYAEHIKEISPEEEHPFTILVSPSWGDAALLSRCGENLLDPLVATGWRIIIRPHPQSKKSEPALLEKLSERYKDKLNVEWDYERENIYALKKADVMISDFSGIVFDYTFLCDKPVLYVKQGTDFKPYDAYDLITDNLQGEQHLDRMWQFRTLEAIGVELKEEMFPNIKEVIQQTADSEELKEARAKAKAEAWMYQGEAGKRISDFMLSRKVS